MISNSEISSEIDHGGNKTALNINAKTNDIRRLYEILRSELRSPFPKSPHSISSNRCLIRFHNCTPFKITPFWIDFKGAPVKYQSISCSFLDINTSVSHLWFFKAKKAENLDPHKVKVLAVTEETLDSLCRDPNFIDTYYRPKSNDESNFLDLCALCLYVRDNFSKLPILKMSNTACPHKTGDSKLLYSNNQCRSWQPLDPSYIYTCDDSAHRLEHATKRRNVYLVEPFFSLRELCFLALEKNIEHTEIVCFGLPESLQKEYLSFITNIRKLSENK